MTRRSYLGLFLAGLVINLAVAALEHSAGSMDADYYYAGGLRLAQGHGFSEIVLWNFLDDPQALPHPSHGYWYPLASIVAGAGMALTGSTSYPAARIGFIFIAALVAPLTAALAYRLTHRADLAVTAGALALFPTYLTAFLPSTDNYGLYMVLGAGFFLLLDRGGKVQLLMAGLCAGLMNLARSDGLLWLVAGLFFIFLAALRASQAHLRPGSDAVGLRERWGGVGLGMAAFVAGYALIMAPWFARNFVIWGTALAPGGGRALLLQNYADTFAYPASRLTLSNLLSAGWNAILDVRLSALLANANTTFTLQLSVVLLPLTVVGAWRLRRETIVQVALLIWIVLLSVMSLLFPFAGPRGSFIHAGSALYAVWWSATVAGIGALLGWADSRAWQGLVARKDLLLFSLVALNAVFSCDLVYWRVYPLDWDRTDRLYSAVETRLLADGAAHDLPVIVIDPPAYFTATGRPAVVIPDESRPGLLELTQKFNAGYLILEQGHLGSNGLQTLYDDPASDSVFEYIGQVENARIYRILR